MEGIIKQMLRHVLQSILLGQIILEGYIPADVVPPWEILTHGISIEHGIAEVPAEDFIEESAIQRLYQSGEMALICRDQSIWRLYGIQIL